MNQHLANAYGTTGAQSEDAEKIAHVQLFAKLAADEGIDLQKLNDEQIAGLWSSFQSKLAEFPPKKDDEKKDEKKDDEKDKAEKEHEEKKAAAEQEFLLMKEAESKVAEADYLGRVIAHAYVDELKKIAAANGAAAPAAEANKTAAAPAGGSLSELAMMVKGAAKKKEEPPPEKKDESKRKKASALDEFAARAAVVKVAEANLDPSEAATRLEALFTLGLPDTESKVASTSNFSDAVEVRSLELLEQVGYPVKWEQAAGQ